MAVTGTYVVDADIANHLTAEYRTNLTEDSDTFEQQHLDGAEAELDSYLAQRYTLPIAGVPDVQILKSCALWLMQERMETANREVNPDTVDMADNCRTILEAIRDGKQTLGVDEAGQIYSVIVPPKAQDETARIFLDGSEFEGEDTTTERVGFATNPEPFSRV